MQLLRKYPALTTLVLFFIVLLVASFFRHYFNSPKQQAHTNVVISPTSIPTPTLALDVVQQTLLSSPSSNLSFQWSPTRATTMMTLYGQQTGVMTQASIQTPTAQVTHFENIKVLQSLSFVMDNNLSADGPGSSSWGYKKISGQTSQIVIYSYRTTPTSTKANAPLQFACPCESTLTIFISDKFSIQ